MASYNKKPIMVALGGNSTACRAFVLVIELKRDVPITYPRMMEVRDLD
mgnify:CR=1 FL=1